MVLPRVKEEKREKGAFKGTLIFDKNCPKALFAFEILSLFNMEIPFKKGKNPNVVFLEKKAFSKGEYTLFIKEEEVEISFGDAEGIRNAVSTLASLYKEKKIDCCEIKDKPCNSFRSCMLDLARGYVPLPVLKEHIIRMAYLKFNYLHLHLMDRQSYALKSDIVPNSGKNKVYTKKEMREVVKLSKSLAIEIIPEIEIPAHAVNIIKEIPALSCDIIDKRAALEKIKNLENPRKREFTDNKTGVSAWVICAGKETTYRIYEKIVKEICSIFDGKYFHIGADELILSSLGAHPHWENCSSCKKKMKEENLSNVGELYLYLIKRMNNIVKSYGKKMIMWNDCIDFSGENVPPKDVTIEFWRGDKEAFKAIFQKGYEVINADCNNAYVDFPGYMQTEKIRTWHPSWDASDENILGGEMCAWELGNPIYSFYPYSLPVCMALFSDRVWNKDAVLYDDEYKKAVFSAVFLRSENKKDISAFFEEVIPPRDKDKNFLEEIGLDKINLKELKDAIGELEKLKKEKLGGKMAISSYLELLKSIEYILR